MPKIVLSYQKFPSHFLPYTCTIAYLERACSRERSRSHAGQRSPVISSMCVGIMIPCWRLCVRSVSMKWAGLTHRVHGHPQITPSLLWMKTLVETGSHKRTTFLRLHFRKVGMTGCFLFSIVFHMHSHALSKCTVSL